MKIMASYRHILKYTGIFGGIQAVTMLASILRNKAAALLIDRYGQGINELFSNTVNLISTATTLVMPVSVVRRLSQLYEQHGDGSEQLREEIRLVRSWSVLTGAVATLLTMAAAPLLSVLTLGSANFIRSFIFLSPILLLISINGTEVAILKATRRLRPLAVASALSSVTTLVVSVLSYWLWSLRGIVIALDFSLLLTATINLACTVKAYPYRAAPLRWSVLRRGGSLIKLSIAFLAASVVAALAEMLVRAYISNNGSIENVGLYGAGFVLTITYTKFIFAAMDADYYPRLSGLVDNMVEANVAINRQVVVCVVLVVPCLILFTLFLPQVIRLLYRPEYLEIVPMVMCATPIMFSKAVCSPVAYTALAKGDSRMYLIIETISALLMGGFVIGGYAAWGLMGAGIGLTVSNYVETVIILTVYNRVYGVRLSHQTVLIIFVELLLLASALIVIAFLPIPALCYPIAIGLALTSALVAWKSVRR